jgi:5-(carboxyamino)imidazole ribonucleotide synthase
MVNLLGDLWKQGEPNWASAAAVDNVKIHLYGKLHARPGRKMGHLTALADTVDEALAAALHARRLLTR